MECSLVLTSRSLVSRKELMKASVPIGACDRDTIEVEEETWWELGLDVGSGRWGVWWE